jgi:hypothetical protein
MSMTDATVEEVSAALSRERRIGRAQLCVGVDGGDLVLAGEVEGVAEKKLALEVAAATPGVDRILDRLHVRPSLHVSDPALLDLVCEVLLADQSLQALRVAPHGAGIPRRPPPELPGDEG